MISFALQNVQLLTVALAALAAFIICVIGHFVFPRKGCCGYKQDGCCPSNKQPNMPNQNYNQQHCPDDIKGLCHRGDMTGILFYKAVLYAVLFVQAYGLAFALERVGVLMNLKDAIAVALFFGVTFSIIYMFKKVFWRKMGIFHFVVKAGLRALELAVMAWIYVYFAGGM